MLDHALIARLLYSTAATRRQAAAATTTAAGCRRRWRTALLLNCLTRAPRGGALRPEPCEWHAAAEPASPPWSPPTHTAATARQRARQRAAGGVLLPAPCLSPEAVKQASRRALAESGLFDRLEPMLGYLCAILRESQTTARQKAVKALTSVVRADPDVLRLAAVTAAVQLALREPSISVREATLDLLGGTSSSSTRRGPPDELRASPTSSRCASA